MEEGAALGVRRKERVEEDDNIINIHTSCLCMSYNVCTHVYIVCVKERTRSRHVPR